MLKWAAYSFCTVASIALLWLAAAHKINLGGVETEWMEVLAALTGAWSVWLAVKVHIWTWPTTIISSVVTGIVLWEGRIFANAYLQVLYIVLGLLGWYWWLYGGKNRTELPIAVASRRELGFSILAGALFTLPVWMLLGSAKDPAPFIDAFTTAFSLVAQYLQTRKLIDNWIAWTVVNLIYIPLFVVQHYYFFAAVTVLYLYLAVLGFIDWKRDLAKSAAA
jgi:nicotinamide mononucleotide transporter